MSYINKIQGILERKFSFLDSNIAKLKNLSFIEHLENRRSSLIGHSQRLREEEEFKQETLKNLEDELTNMDREVKREEEKEGKENDAIIKLKIKKNKAKEILEAKRAELEKLNQDIEQFQMIHREANGEMDQIERKYMEESNSYEQGLKKLLREAQNWNKKTYHILYNSHRHFDLDLFTKHPSSP
jgi:chromosome segregation ATPase